MLGKRCCFVARGGDVVRALVALAGFQEAACPQPCPGLVAFVAQDLVLMMVGVVAAALESCDDISSDFLIAKSTRISF